MRKTIYIAIAPDYQLTLSLYFSFPSSHIFCERVVKCCVFQAFRSNEYNWLTAVAFCIHNYIHTHIHRRIHTIYYTVLLINLHCTTQVRRPIQWNLITKISRNRAEISVNHVCVHHEFRSYVRMNLRREEKKIR